MNLAPLLLALAVPPSRPEVPARPLVVQHSNPVFNGRARQLAVKPPRVEATVTIDGVLDEPVWKDAALMNGFSQFAPQDGIPSADSTQVLVWYSPTAIHFGIRAFQPAGTVRATLADRDKISQDDNVQLLIGTFNDGRQATVFMVNPLGVQADGMLVERGTTSGGSFLAGAATREAPDLSPDFVYESKGHVTEWGYEVEIRIPFKSLRYQPADVQTWSINVVRKVQYSGYEDSWAPALRAAASFLGQSGTLTGLTELHRGLVVDLTPEATQRTQGAPGTTGAAWNYAAGRPQIGGNVRWGVTNNLTLNGTVNPDFSQVEADAGQINFDPRAQISYPEKRPFFLDGLEQFGVPNNLIYTRRIVQPVAAVKLTGKVESTEIALLSAVDAANSSASGRGNPVFTIIRLQRDLGRESRLGMAYTDRIDGANSNRVLDIDGRFVWKRVYSLQVQGAASATKISGIETNAPFWDLHFLRSGHSFSWRSQFTGIEDNFVTKSGFISRAGQIHANWNPSYTWFAERGSALESIAGDILVDDIWAYHNFTHSGDARDKKLHFNLHSNLRGGWQLGASLLLESFGFDPAYYSGLYRVEVPRAGLPSDTLPFTGTPRLPNRDWVISFSTPQLKYLTLGGYYIWGQDENFYEWSSARIQALSVSADIRASDQIRIGLTYNLSDYIRRTDGSRPGWISDPRIKVEYQVNREIFVRVIGEYFANQTDALRDDSRTNGPLLVFDSGSQRWLRTVANQSNSVRTDFLFAYKPVPGTVFYAGYGAQMYEPQSYQFRGVDRASDAFFVKASYLFRM